VKNEMPAELCRSAAVKINDVFAIWRHHITKAPCKMFLNGNNELIHGSIPIDIVINSTPGKFKIKV